MRPRFIALDIVVFVSNPWYVHAFAWPPRNGGSEIDIYLNPAFLAVAAPSSRFSMGLSKTAWLPGRLITAGRRGISPLSSLWNCTVFYPEDHLVADLP